MTNIRNKRGNFFTDIIKKLRKVTYNLRQWTVHIGKTGKFYERQLSKTDTIRKRKCDQLVSTREFNFN